ncbi:MAG TPA: TonB-dependent receptor [Sphingomonas sp.]|uniref:TonB-dependent receptor n=1 Tax=Sphingomonas sp. TaxID=28214 RepID=UPI002BED121D|nr:TonB-dependent receptor [Sphingomonas sp.]HMI20352.1 TonB-dependent receptor [Sphingomonas sp.]
MIGRIGSKTGVAYGCVAAFAFLASGRAEAKDKEKSEPADVVVTGQRGSAVSNILPLTTFDTRQIEAIGATSMADLLRVLGPMAQSADGSEPIYLLNGQRTSSYEEIGSLPPEAIAKAEVLPEEAALKFGYPPTRRLLNFITKAHYHSVEVKAGAGMSTHGGGGAATANASLTRIDNGRRLTLAGEYRHTDPLRQSRRQIIPDSSSPFDAIGNVTGATGGEIDPALSAAAGHKVFIAAVPADPAARDQIGAYVAGADQPRIFDIGPYRTLVGRNDAFKINAVLATSITQAISGSFTLSAERSWDRSLQGPAAAAIQVQANNPYSPFGSDVLLYRYLTEDAPLVQRRVTTTLNAGAVLRGAIGGWTWDMTGTFNEYDVTSHSDRGVDQDAIDQAVVAGTDPFAPLPATLLADRQTQLSTSRSRKGEAKFVIRGTALRLPAGDLDVTATGEAERATAHTESCGIIVADSDLGRTRLEAGLSANVPIASHDDNVLPFLGALSADLSGNVRHVEGYGELTDSTYGLTWSPLKTVQLIGTIKNSEAAPTMAQRSATIVQSTNVPYFDFNTGQSVLVTTISGGNPDLLADRRRVKTLSLNWRAIGGEGHWNALNISLSYTDSLIHDQSAQASALTAATEAAFPDQFVRDPITHQLTTVLLRPVNFYRERQRGLQMQFNYYGPLGKKPAPSGDPAHPPQRPNLYVGMQPRLSLDDTLQFRPGLPPIDVLHGGTYNGSGGRPKLTIYGWGGISKKAVGMNFDWQYYSAKSANGGTPESDLHFSSLFKVGGSGYVRIGDVLPRQPWAHGLSVILDVTNLLDHRQRVRDGNGQTPNRYQLDYLDPLGRTLKLSLRKLF